ncbi:MAG TPA: CHASE2 domain-containing protein, partial [Rhizobiales bacterium]|nr:CHASE2 domain-containing protein [Hyphomicrobiales bacterium]
MKHSRWLAVLFGLIIVAALAALRSSDGFIAHTVRNLTFDRFQQLAPRKKISQPVRVIDIDETSLAKIGQFPWPRTEFAKLVDELNKLGAAAIVFDVLFSEPDRLSPKNLLKREDLKKWLGGASSDNPAGRLRDNDKVFAASVAKAPVIMAFASNRDGSPENPASKSGFAFTGNATLKALPDTGNITHLLPELEKAATGIGSMSISPDGSQETIREYPLLWSHNGKVFPSLAMEALRVAQGASTFIIRGG